MVRWWWFGIAVEKPEILRELQQMKADGIGGAELAFVYPQVLDDPAKNLINQPFVSLEMLDNVRYAQTEGRKLGLRIDVTLGSGWPYGGPATTLDHAARRLRVLELPIPANATSLPVAKLGDGESIISISVANLIPGGCGFAYGNTCPAPSVPNPAQGRNPTPAPATWDAASAQTFPANTTSIPPAPQPRVALIFIDGHTGQQVKRAAAGAEGWVLDPFSQQAVATHLTAVGEPLLKAFGDNPPYAIFSDSLEAYGADWTPDLPAEFIKRRGYDLIPHLPELVAGETPAADKVRHDWGQTLTELVNQNYLTQINNWAIAHHTKFRSQTYGEPAVSFSSQKLATLPEGEGPQWRAFSTLRWAISANHVFGNNVTSGETFTWLHSPVFRATPLDMKAEADIDFIMGENQLIFHGWPYSPPDGKVPEPGWSLYAAAVFNDHNPWHPVMPEVTRYIQRVSALLRQGQPANQVAILLPTDDAWAGFSPANPVQTSITGAMQKLITPELMSAILSAGYNLDYIDAEAIDSVGLGTHQILVIPPTDRIPAATIEKIAAWSKSGGKVISIGRAPSLDPTGNPIASVPFASLFPEAVLIPDTGHLTDALHKAVTPDLQFTGDRGEAKTQIGFIRRKLPTADVYFVVNTSNQTVDAVAAFATAYQHGLAIDPDSAVSTTASAGNQAVRLAPYESRIFFFSAAPVPPKPPTKSSLDAPDMPDLATNWKVAFTATGKTVTEPTLTDWTSDPATRNYSGEAVYSHDFTLSLAPKSDNPIYLQVDGGMPLPGAPNSPPEHPVLGANGLPDPRVTRTGPGMHAYFNPPIHEAALVTINGQPAGALWHPPYRLDITKLLKSGPNHIEIHVFNTALNAWSALPPHDYKPLIAKYGDRFQMQDLNQVEPIPSGILGQIHLVTGEDQ